MKEVATKSDIDAALRTQSAELTLKIVGYVGAIVGAATAFLAFLITAASAV